MKSIAIVAFFLAVFPAVATADALAGKKKSELCVLCHFARNDGDMKFIPVLEGQPREYFVAQIKAFQTKLRTNPVMEQNAANLTAADAQDIADYFAAQKPARSPSLDASLVGAGVAKLRELRCGTCHLPNYSGQGEAARLAGQNPKYTAWTLHMIAFGNRRHPAEAASELKSLTNDDIDRIAHAFASM